MQIALLDDGQSIPNRTRKYLKPYLYTLPVWQYLRKIPHTFIACGIAHKEIEGFFFLIQTDQEVEHEDIIQSYYVGELGFGNLHMLQIRFPHDMINLFKKGSYSKLYANPAEVLELNEDNWVNKERKDILGVLSKCPIYRQELMDKLSLPTSPVFIEEDAELDDKPVFYKESFDYETRN